MRPDESSSTCHHDVVAVELPAARTSDVCRGLVHQAHLSGTHRETYGCISLLLYPPAWPISIDVGDGPTPADVVWPGLLMGMSKDEGAGGDTPSSRTATAEYTLLGMDLGDRPSSRRD